MFQRRDRGKKVVEQVDTANEPVEDVEQVEVVTKKLAPRGRSSASASATTSTAGEVTRRQPRAPRTTVVDESSDLPPTEVQGVVPRGRRRTASNLRQSEVPEVELPEVPEPEPTPPPKPAARPKAQQQTQPKPQPKPSSASTVQEAKPSTGLARKTKFSKPPTGDTSSFVQAAAEARAEELKKQNASNISQNVNRTVRRDLVKPSGASGSKPRPKPKVVEVIEVEESEESEEPVNPEDDFLVEEVEILRPGTDRGRARLYVPNPDISVPVLTNFEFNRLIIYRILEFVKDNPSYDSDIRLMYRNERNVAIYELYAGLLNDYEIDRPFSNGESIRYRIGDMLLPDIREFAGRRI